jgi:hypothetical protein
MKSIINEVYTIMRKFNYVIIGAFVLSVGLAFVLLTLPTGADTTTPDYYRVTFYKTELSTDGANWVTVFANESGKVIDLTNPAAGGAVFGQGAAIQPGIYNAIKFTIKNEITYAYSTTVTNGSSLLRPSLMTDTQVSVFFVCTSTTWANDGSTLDKAFPLPDPIRVELNVTSKIIVNFGVSDSLWSDDNWNTSNLKPPVITVAVVSLKTDSAPLLTGPTAYYFIRNNLRFPAMDVVTPTRLALESGWGTITMTPSAENADYGTFTIAQGNNRFHERWIGTDGLTQGGSVVTDTSPAISGKYYVDADGYINMLMPGTSGIIRGALRNDGKVFAAVEISSPSSQTVDTEISYQMFYAVKKETNVLVRFDGYYSWNQSMTELRENVIDDVIPYPEGYGLSHSVGVGWLQSGAITASAGSAASRLEMDCPLSPTAQTVRSTEVSYDEPQEFPASELAISPTGIWDYEYVDGVANMHGFVLGDSSLAIFGGTEIANDNPMTYTEGSNIRTEFGHIITMGVVLKTKAVTGTWTTANVAGTYSFVYKGDYRDEGMGNALPNYWVQLGRITLDGQGNVSGRAIKCQKGQTAIEDLSVYRYTVGVEKVGANLITGTAGTDFIWIDVIKLYKTDPDAPYLLMLIGDDGKTLAPYSPLGTGLTEPLTPNNERGFGLAIKQD